MTNEPATPLLFSSSAFSGLIDIHRRVCFAHLPFYKLLRTWYDMCFAGTTTTARWVYRAAGGVVHDERRGPRRGGRQARTCCAPEPLGVHRRLVQASQDCGVLFLFTCPFTGYKSYLKMIDSLRDTMMLEPLCRYLCPACLFVCCRKILPKPKATLGTNS